MVSGGRRGSAAALSRGDSPMLSRLIVVAAFAVLSASTLARAADPVPAGASSDAGRYFEMRKYYAMPGKLADLNARFRDHTCALFQKHGMEIVGFWVPTEGPEADKVLVYVLAYPSKEARETSWKGFRDDPDWNTAREASEKNGKLVEKIESTFMRATDYSPMK